MEKIATRDAYGEKLVELGSKNRDIVVLDADLAKSTKTIRFKEKFPDRFFDMGVAEQNLIGTAAGCPWKNSPAVLLSSPQAGLMTSCQYCLLLPAEYAGCFMQGLQ